MKRRDFLRLGAGAAALAAFPMRKTLAAAAAAPAAAPPPPRWRGFNLLEMFSGTGPVRPFREADFEMMAGWGFNFARIPMSYWRWSKPDVTKWLEIDEQAITPVDGAVALGRRHGVHVNLNLHRIPGYCINGADLEPVQLFTGPPEDQARALEAACHHWRFFARRYRGIPSTELSFDLINEPPVMDPAGYVRVVRALVAAIRAIDPDRLIVADGIDVGRKPVPELADLGIMQSTRGYDPMGVSHYRATWVPGFTADSWPRPSWPMDFEGVHWDRTTLRERLIKPWQAVEALGVKVHVGEWGCYRYTPHAVALAWMTDLLGLWQEAGWGWAMWNLRGDFGVLDSQRADVTYENYRGLKLDRAMLELLRTH
jgi:endoglucanase